MTARRTPADRFPDGFLWGAATSAFQIEGSPLADGAGASHWYRFSHTPGRIENGENADVACDHYRRWADDVDLMRTLELAAYRFSVSWSRILPDGRGRPNPRGLAFYDQLVDRLLANGIRPFPTLYHWDLPAALDDRGGWLNPDIAEQFADYARVMFHALGDRVTMWATLNEPWVVVDAGYLFGVHAPGHKSPFEAPRAAHHLLLAHGRAVQAGRSEGNGAIGLVVNLEPKDAASDSPEDLAARERADAYMNRQFLDPVFHGRYPAGLPGIFGEAWPEFPAEDFAIIRQRLDFLGINYYTRNVVRHDPDRPPVYASPVHQDGATYTDLGWEVHPESLRRVLLWVRESYGQIPLYITENGAAFPEPARSPVGGLLDTPRVDYLRDHLYAVHDALAAGVDVRGYFAWSLLDNFEWACGTSKRFGLVHVDFATQRRTPKASARFYRDVIRSNGASLFNAAGGA